jgi:hypothetical protein
VLRTQEKKKKKKKKACGDDAICELHNTSYWKLWIFPGVGKK